MVQKIYSKMHPVSCTNTHHDITDLVNYGIVKNTKTWISQERNITFLWNIKVLHLCLRWHILRSYCSAEEVTLNKNKVESKMENPAHSFREVNHVLQLVKEWEIKSKTVMSWSSRNKKECIFCNVYFARRKFVIYLNV